MRNEGQICVRWQMICLFQFVGFCLEDKFILSKACERILKTFHFSNITVFCFCKHYHRWRINDTYRRCIDDAYQYIQILFQVLENDDFDVTRHRPITWRAATPIGKTEECLVLVRYIVTLHQHYTECNKISDTLVIPSEVSTAPL